MLLVAAIFFSTIVACQIATTSSYPENSASKTLPVPTDDEVCSIASDQNEIWKNAWRKFRLSSKYRIARSSDFKFDSATSRDSYTKIDRETWASCPVRWGDFNGDRVDDFAVFIVDPSETNKNFSLAILASINAKEESYEPMLVLTKVDLSKAFLSKSRAGLLLLEEDGNKSITLCKILWNAPVRLFSCGLESRLGRSNIRLLHIAAADGVHAVLGWSRYADSGLNLRQSRQPHEHGHGGR